MEPLTTEQFDRLCDWLADAVATMADEEIDAELKELGIDVGPAVKRIREALDRRLERNVNNAPFGTTAG